jgi:hypothetical protein
VVVLSVLLALARQGRNVAAPHGDGGARVDRSLRGGLVRSFLHRPIVDVAMTQEPCGTPALDARDDRLEVGERRRGGRVERDAPARVARKNAVEDDDVKVDVEIQTAESLHERDGAAL